MRAVLMILPLLIFVAITFYIGWNVRAWLKALHIYRWPLLYWVLLYAISFGYFIGKMHPLLTPLSVLGSYWLFVMQYGILLCIIANVLVKFTPLTTKMVGTGAVSIFAILFMIGTYYAYSPVTRSLEIEIDKPGEDMRVVMASDFHLGVLSNKGHLENFVEMSNEAKPDLVLLAGDLVDDSPMRFINTGMGEVLSQLTSTYGVYGVPGNHEYYGGEIPLFIETMKDAGVEILMDDTVLVADKFYVTGREDLTNKERVELTELVPENRDLPWIVLDHTPQDLQTPAELAVDFHVSGHTHKGQLWPNHLITQRIFELDYGHAVKESMHALVSSGYGFWGPPMRTGSRAELWIIDVKFNGQ
ncbi:MAG: metallophosphoesterase [Solibacillus sp.]